MDVFRRRKGADQLHGAPRGLGLTLVTIGVLPAMLIVGAFLVLAHPAPARGDEYPCVRMLGGAPERIRLLEAVRSCSRADAGCAYVEPTPGYGVLTLICPHVVQVVFAERLTSLELRAGAWSGECSSGSWQLGLGLPGCYPARWPLAP